nr:hypothetical protein [Tanacetum cinerariifolium]
MKKNLVVEDDNDSMMIDNSQAVLDPDEMKKNVVNEANDLMVNNSQPMFDSEFSLDMSWSNSDTFDMSWLDSDMFDISYPKHGDTHTFDMNFHHVFVENSMCYFIVFIIFPSPLFSHGMSWDVWVHIIRLICSWQIHQWNTILSMMRITALISFHDIGDVEFQDNWSRVWVDIGTSDYFALDVLLTVLSSEYLGIQQVVFSGRSMGDWEEGMKNPEDGYKSFKI